MSEIKDINVGKILREIIDDAYYEKLHAKRPRTREEKLNHLIEILKRVKPLEERNKTRFYMSNWIYIPERVVGEIRECGFSGCALGWASTDPVFKAMGLSNDGESIWFEPCGPIDNPKESSFEGIEAGMHLLDLKRAETEFLFIPTSYYVRDIKANLDLNRSFGRLTETNPTLFYNKKFRRISTSKVIKRIEFVRDNPSVLS